MALTKITDYDIEILEIITEFFKGSNVEDLLKTISSQLEELENMWFQLLDERNIDDAVGWQLDIIGKILNLPRLGRDDVSYRNLLKLKAKINSSYGDPEILIETVKLLYNADDVIYVPNYPAGVIVQQDGDPGLYFLNDLYTIGLVDNIVTTTGDQICTREEDTIATELLEAVIPSGVELTIQNIP